MNLSRQNFELIRIVISSIIGITAFAMMMPLTTLILAERGYSPSTIGFFAAIPMTTIFIGTFVLNYLLTKFTAGQIYFFSFVLPLFTILIFITSDNFYLWCLANMCIGLYATVRWVITEAMILEFAPEKKRGKFLGIYETFLGAGFALGPFILSQIGVDGSAFKVLSALYILSIILVLKVPKLNKNDEHRKVKKFDFRILRKIFLIVLLAFLGGFYENGLSNISSVYSLTFNVSAEQAAQVAAIIGFGSFACQYIAGVIADKYSFRTLNVSALLILIFSTSSILIWREFELLKVIAFIWGGVGGAVYTICMVKLGSKFRGTNLMLTTSALVSAYTFGAIISPAIGGVAIRLDSYFGLPILLTTITLVVLSFTIFKR
jgi:predicted MFS family arabinose efflux permease